MQFTCDESMVVQPVYSFILPIRPMPSSLLDRLRLQTKIALAGILLCAAASAAGASDLVMSGCDLPLGCVSFSPSSPTSVQNVGISIVAYSGIPNDAVIPTLNTSVIANVISISGAYVQCHCDRLGTPTFVNTSLEPLAAGHYTLNFTASADPSYGPNGYAPILITASLDVTPASAQTQPYNIQVVPQAPQSLEQVRLHVTSLGGPEECIAASVSMQANTITVTIFCLGTLPLLPPFPVSSFDVELGRFPAGTYDIVVIEAGAATPAINAAFTVAERHIFVAPYVFPIADFTDHWWNPLEPGWGISIHQHASDRVFAIWFVYSQTGLPVWYTLQPGAWTSPTVYAGPVYRTAGPYFGGPFDPSQVVASLVGSATLSFTDSNTGIFSYTVEGISGSKPIARLPF
jgi:hypothetical protein